MGDGVLVGGGRVGHAERDAVDAVTVALVVLGDLVIAGQGAGQHEPDPALLEHTRDAVPAAGLQAAVGGLGEAEGVAVVVRGLSGVADIQLEVIDAVHRHHVGGGGAGVGIAWIVVTHAMIRVRAGHHKTETLRTNPRLPPNGQH